MGSGLDGLAFGFRGFEPSLEADFCVEALNEAIHRFGPPEIMNTDQGSQFTSFAWTDRLRRSGVCISMDGNLSKHWGVAQRTDKRLLVLS